MIDLKSTFGKRYRIQLDASYEAEQYEGKTKDVAWYYEIVGQRGELYNHSDSHCQIWLRSPRLGKTLSEHLPPSWRVTQNTSEGYGFVFPNSDISIAFKWIKPRKRRIGRPAPHLAKYAFQREAKP